MAANEEGSEFNQLNQYSAQISEEGLSVLLGTLGYGVYTIYSPCLQVAGMHLTSPSFSVPIFNKETGHFSHQYLVVRCLWSETPLLLTDYWQLLVSLEDKPDGIDVNPTGAVVAPCTIKYFQATPIVKIDIYEYEWQSDSEAVTYDNAIRFEQESGSAFCIACQLNGPGIATEVHISEDEVTIQEFLDGSHIRLSLTS